MREDGLEKMIKLSELKTLFQKYKISPLKRFGQNFLVDPNMAEKILFCCRIGKNDFVIEIGPGLGQLTQGLCEKAGAVAAVEIDKKISQILKDRFKNTGNLEIICQDFLKFDLKGYLETRGIGEIIIYGNLPYYITSPILVRILENKTYAQRAYLVMQKEVAKRLAALPGTKDYGAITCFIQYSARPKILFDISKSAFYPRPEVDSSLVELEILARPEIAVKDEKTFFAVIRASFNQRRKTLLNSLSASRELDLAKKEAAFLLEKSGIDGNRRGETLSLLEFAKIADNL